MIPKKLQKLLDELESIEDEFFRSDLLIEYSERFIPVPESIAAKPYPASSKVPACESEVYVFYKKDSDNKLKYHFAVDNPQGISAMAMASIITETLDGASNKQIAAINDDLVYKIFGKGISMGKGMGLRSLVGVVRTIAENNIKD